jgi:hypothetical protein
MASDLRRDRPRSAKTLAVAALVLGATLAGCSGGSGQSAAKSGGTSTGQPSSSGSPTPGRGVTIGSTKSPAPPTPPAEQSCKDRLGSGETPPPAGVPRLKGSVFDAGQPTQGLYAAHLPGVSQLGPAQTLRAKFAAKGLHPSAIKTAQTASSFTFSGKYGGTVYVAVLCQGYLREAYVFTSGKARVSPSPTASASVKPSSSP